MSACHSCVQAVPLQTINNIQTSYRVCWTLLRRHRHSEVWRWPGSDTARRTSMARRPRPGDLQAGSDSSPVSEQLRTTVPVGLLRPCRQCWSAASEFHQLSTACSTLLPAQHLRPSGFFSCRPHSLELTPEFHPGPDHQFGLFQTAA